MTGDPLYFSRTWSASSRRRHRDTAITCPGASWSMRSSWDRKPSKARMSDHTCRVSRSPSASLPGFNHVSQTTTATPAAMTRLLWGLLGDDHPRNPEAVGHHAELFGEERLVQR